MANDQDHNTFQVVLIDLKKAANWEIVCVKKPLTEDLKYVAISYRWGELQETIIDTGVGYLASITSFALDDFYRLCVQMTKEVDLQFMDYVWVDAISVNQSNHDERKATIYHMSDIYELASWILAVPDLHKEHLKAMHVDIVGSVRQHDLYLYHLLHGDTDDLYQMDNAFLDEIGAPQDANMRQILTKYTDSFADSFMTPVTWRFYYNRIHTLRHLYNNNNNNNNNNNKTSEFLQTILGKILRTQPAIEPPHQCDEIHCPFEYFENLSKGLPFQGYQSGEWCRPIVKRRSTIKGAMRFLTALVVDWSTRVWVISEFHISKKKNNLKFWFNQLELIFLFQKSIIFFKFDMNDPWLARIQDTQLSDGEYSTRSDPVYFNFYRRLINQLNRQTFLEMMLKSKASKNEDRFYAIFPFFPEYKHLLLEKELGNMNSILSVKLKLYQVMTSKDKLWLFYLSSGGKMSSVLPTFATTTIEWPETDNREHDDLVVNATPVDITLLYQENVGQYLRVKPTKYNITRNVYSTITASKALSQVLYPKITSNDRVDVLQLFDTASSPLLLVGSFDKNIWIVGNKEFHYSTFDTVQDLADDFPGFRVF